MIDTSKDIQGLVVHGTKDYKRFKTIPGNRKVEKSQINRLLTDITNYNQLDTNPIVVNENWEVINGQTRLKVAQELDNYIWYIQKSGLDREAMKACNRTQTPWQTKDYVISYAEEGLADYAIVLETSTKTHVSISNLLFLFNRKVGKRDSVSHAIVRNGLYKVSTYDQGMQIVNVIDKFEDVSMVLLTNNRSLLSALYMYRFKYGQDFNTLLSALKQTKTKLLYLNSPVGYLGIFEELSPFMYKKRK